MTSPFSQLCFRSIVHDIAAAMSRRPVCYHTFAKSLRFTRHHTQLPFEMMTTHDSISICPTSKILRSRKYGYRVCTALRPTVRVSQPCTSCAPLTTPGCSSLTSQSHPDLNPMRTVNGRIAHCPSPHQRAGPPLSNRSAAAECSLFNIPTVKPASRVPARARARARLQRGRVRAAGCW